MITEILLGLDLLALRFLNNKRLEGKPVGAYELKLGYKNTLLYKRPILVDMRICPHIFVSGLSGQGKTKMIEKAIQGKNVVLINVFEHDFKTIQARRINGNDNILKFLNHLLQNMREGIKRTRPLFLVFDELLVLCIDKRITQLITDVLAIGRHSDVYCIGISQAGTSEAVKNKFLYNCRICFKQVEESSYRVILGYSPEDKDLHQREFYLYSDIIERGKTYSI